MTKTHIAIQYDSGESLTWKDMGSLPGAGKYLLLNLSPTTKSLFISTGYIQSGMTEETLADYLKWAVAWDDFPNITYELNEQDKEIA